MSAHLVHIDDHSEDVAETEDNDNSYQDHGDVVVPLLSAGGLLVQAGHVGDGRVDQAVGDGIKAIMKKFARRMYPPI